MGRFDILLIAVEAVRQGQRFNLQQVFLGGLVQIEKPGHTSCNARVWSPPQKLQEMCSGAHAPGWGYAPSA